MPIFTDAEMREFADIFEELGMPDSCTIARNGLTDSPYGTKEDLVVIGESICLVSDPASGPSSDLLKMYADRLGGMVAWPVSLPIGTDVLEGDILTVTCQLIAQTQKMKVQVVLSPKSFPVSINVIAAEIKPL